MTAFENYIKEQGYICPDWKEPSSLGRLFNLWTKDGKKPIQVGLREKQIVTLITPLNAYVKVEGKFDYSYSLRDEIVERILQKYGNEFVLNALENRTQIDITDLV